MPEGEVRHADVVTGPVLDAPVERGDGVRRVPASVRVDHPQVDQVRVRCGAVEAPRVPELRRGDGAGGGVPRGNAGDHRPMPARVISRQRRTAGQEIIAGDDPAPPGVARRREVRMQAHPTVDHGNPHPGSRPARIAGQVGADGGDGELGGPPHLEIRADVSDLTRGEHAAELLGRRGHGRHGKRDISAPDPGAGSPDRAERAGRLPKLKEIGAGAGDVDGTAGCPVAGFSREPARCGAGDG